MQEWLRGFEEACLEADNIRTLPSAHFEHDPSDLYSAVDDVDKLRICSSDDLDSVEEVISRDLIDGVQVIGI